MLIVLGIDSLDGGRIESFDTPHLDLEQHGVMQTPEGLTAGELRTKVLWPSMLIGKHPRDIYPGYPYPTGQNSGEWSIGVLNNPVVQALENIATRALPAGVQRKLLEAVGTAGVDRERPHHTHQSLLDVAESPHAISIPGYNEDESNTELRQRLTHPEGDWSTTVSASSFESMAAAADADRMFRTLAAVRARQSDLVWTHLFSHDPVQHLWATDDVRMDRWHTWYDNYVGQVLAEASDDDTIVIVSDHGMEDDGKHSQRAYFASSKPLWDDDVYEMVNLRSVLERELEQHSVERTETDDDLGVSDEIRAHLEDLGYA